MSEINPYQKFWFYWSKGEVCGPFHEHELRIALKLVSPKNDLKVWRIGTIKPLSYTDWLEEDLKIPMMWKGKTVRFVDSKFAVIGPMEPTAAIEYLRQRGNTAGLQYKIDGFVEKWTAMMNLDQVFEILNAAARKYPRIKCQGTAVFVSRPESKSTLDNISVGGFRCAAPAGIQPPKVLRGFLKIGDLKEDFEFSAELKNVSAPFWGLEFTEVSHGFSYFYSTCIEDLLKKEAERVFAHSLSRAG